MENVFDELNKINDDEYRLTGSEAIEGAVIAIVDDARTFDMNELVDDISQDYDDEMEYLDEGIAPTPRIIVSEEDVKSILDNIAKCRYFKLTKRPENLKFTKGNNLGIRDIESVLKQLDIGDYSYTVESKSEYHNGAYLNVFITSKDFKLSDRELSGVTIYIKLECTDAGPICIVSFHGSKNKGKHPYKK